VQSNEEKRRRSLSVLTFCFLHFISSTNNKLFFETPGRFVMRRIGQKLSRTEEERPQGACRALTAGGPHLTVVVVIVVVVLVIIIMVVMDDRSRRSAA
jgi:hypothetical protein